MKTRVCRECHNDKNIDCFEQKNGINRHKRKDGTIVVAPYITRRYVCIKCMNDIYTADYVRRNRKKVNNYLKGWQKEQKDNKTDHYYKLLIQPNVPYRLITKDLIKLKRKEHEIKEFIKKHS